MGRWGWGLELLRSNRWVFHPALELRFLFHELMKMDVNLETNVGPFPSLNEVHDSTLARTSEHAP